MSWPRENGLTKGAIPQTGSACRPVSDHLRATVPYQHCQTGNLWPLLRSVTYLDNLHAKIKGSLNEMEVQEAVMLRAALSRRDQLADPLPPPAAETVVEDFAGSIVRLQHPREHRQLRSTADDAATLRSSTHGSPRETWGRRGLDPRSENQGALSSWAMDGVQRNNPARPQRGFRPPLPQGLPASVE